MIAAIEAILPANVVAVERHGDRSVRRLELEVAADPVAIAAERRRQEFAAGRVCAQEALARLGIASVPIRTGAAGEPLWPSGTVGSITHCDCYVACAVARTSRIASVGIDAEPHEQLPEGVLGEIADSCELSRLADLRGRVGGVYWDRLLFSAKEAVYKAWYPLTGRWLGFDGARVTFESDSGTFTAQLTVAGPCVAGVQLRAFSGRWLVSHGLILTTVVVADAAGG